MPLIELYNVRKSYPDGWALTDVSFTVKQGEIICLLGPSGCGKTTLLRLIAGLEPLESGRVLVNGEDISRTPPHRRGFGLMFQDYALFPHKDVFGNVAFGLRMQGLEREVVVARVAESLELVGLSGFERRDVNQLSGGEQQRVALARSLAPQPRLLMLDEPLGALDRALRERLMEELPAILRRAGVTTITVTHDQKEAFALADRVVLIRTGRVVQVGTPEQVYRHPTSAWAARFLGLTNLLRVRVVGQGLVEAEIGRLEIGDWGLGIGDWGFAVTLLIRPEAARLDVREPQSNGESGPNLLRGTVTERSFRGEHYRLRVRHASGVELIFNLPASVELPATGETITLSLSPQMLALLPAAEDANVE